MLRKLSGYCLANTARNHIRYFGAHLPAPPSPEYLCESMAPFRTNSKENGFVWTSRFGQISMPDQTIEAYVWKNLNKWHDKVAIECGVSGRKYSYGKLRDHCASIAIRLRTDFNLKQGDVVAISMSNIPEYAIAVLGALEAGLKLSMINPASTPEEHARHFSMTDPQLIFCESINLDSVLNACSKNKSKLPVVVFKMEKHKSIPNGVIDFANLIKTKADFSKLNTQSHSAYDVCVMPFSSGTSGLPKGVMLTHKNVTANCEIFGAPNPYDSITIPTTKDHQDVVLVVLPFFHMYGFCVQLILNLSLGCKLVVLPKFHPSTYISTIADRKVTYLPLVPPILQCLANEDRCTSKLLSSVRTIMCAGAPLGRESVDRFYNTKGGHVEILQGYGMTEISAVAIFSHRLYINYGSVGWPAASTEAKIVNVDDPLYRGLDANICGEIMVRSPSVMRGYLNNPTETAKVLTEGGWLRTGDVGWYDNNGDFYITDRSKDLIKVNAFQVSPSELENILISHPMVLEAAVIGVNHDKLGEAPKAFVVRKEAKLTKTDIHDFIAKRCSKFKWLTGGLEFIDEIPKNQTGKILRRSLK